MENSSTSASSPALLRLLWQRQRVPRGAHEDVEEQRAARRARRSSSDDSDDTGGAGGLLKPSSSAEDKAETTGGGEDKEDNKEEDKHEDEELEDEELEEEETEPLAVILVNSIFHLLFLPDFTIEDPNKDFNEQDVNTQAFKSALMWAPGVGCSEKTLANSSQYDWNRIEILRLMIAAFSDSLFQVMRRSARRCNLLFLPEIRVVCSSDRTLTLTTHASLCGWKWAPLRMCLTGRLCFARS